MSYRMDTQTAPVIAVAEKAAEMIAEELAQSNSVV